MKRGWGEDLGFLKDKRGNFWSPRSEISRNGEVYVTFRCPQTLWIAHWTLAEKDYFIADQWICTPQSKLSLSLSASVQRDIIDVDPNGGIYWQHRKYNINFDEVEAFKRLVDDWPQNPSRPVDNCFRQNQRNFWRPVIWLYAFNMPLSTRSLVDPVLLFLLLFNTLIQVEVYLHNIVLLFKNQLDKYSVKLNFSNPSFILD